MSVTQNEIARVTGLSRSTVSTVLSGKFAHNYREETRNRVLDAAKKLNYRPNPQAHTLRTGKSSIIGIAHTGSILPITHQKISEVVRLTVERDLEPLIYYNGWFENQGRVGSGVVDMLLRNRVQGVVLINSYCGDGPSDLERLISTVPVVQLGGQKFPGVPLIAMDKEKAVLDLARHFVAQGHRHVMMVSGGLDCRSLEPVSAFRELFRSPEMASVRHDVVVLKGAPGDRFDLYAPGARAFEMIRELAQGSPVAVICHNDDWAIGVYLRCIQEGIRVPEDWAMAGFDNTFLGSRMPAALTSVEQPIAEMAAEAMEVLLRGEIDGGFESYHPCQLFLRASSEAMEEVG